MTADCSWLGTMLRCSRVSMAKESTAGAMPCTWPLAPTTARPGAVFAKSIVTLRGMSRRNCATIARQPILTRCKRPTACWCWSRDKARDVARLYAFHLTGSRQLIARMISQGMEGWTAFQEFGPVQRFWRARRVGGQLLPHPNHADRKILAVGQRDELPGAGAVWNFTAGRQGTLTIKVRTDRQLRRRTARTHRPAVRSGRRGCNRRRVVCGRAARSKRGSNRLYRNARPVA